MWQVHVKHDYLPFYCSVGTLYYSVSIANNLAIYHFSGTIAREAWWGCGSL
jgi:hypothetical protein